MFGKRNDNQSPWYSRTKIDKTLGRKKTLIEVLHQKKSDRTHAKEAQIESVEGLKTAYHKTITVIQTFNQSYIIPIFRDFRSEQLKDMASDSDNIPDSNKKSRSYYSKNNELIASRIGLGFATAGFFYAPLSLLSIPCFLYLGYFITQDAIEDLVKKQKVTINTLLMTIVMTGTLLGTSALFSGSVLLNFIISLNFFLTKSSRDLIAKIRTESKGNIVDIFRQQAKTVWVVHDGIEVETPIEELQPGDVVVVHAGESIPVDGNIVSGLASIDQRMLTGESQPAEKGPSEPVFALTMVIAGQIQIEVEKAGEETTAAQIGEILNQTMTFKSEMQLWAEDIGNKSVLPTLAIYGTLFPMIGASSAWAILIAHPKHKMTVATYIGILSYLNLASRDGVLIKDAYVLELLNEIDTVVFDKTGTLTEEQPHIGQIYTCHAYTSNDVLTYAAAAEYKQTHPIATAILEEAASRELQIPEISDAAYKVGYGLTVEMGHQLVRVGSLRFIEEEIYTIPQEISQAERDCHEQGHSLVLVAVDDEIAGAIALEPTVRPEVKSIISGLRQRNIKSMYIISGDAEMPTKMLAKELGIEHYFAQVLPENKADLIEELQAEGKMVCYVGDGINDAIALKKAAVSISLRGASTVATDSAQAILMDGNLSKLCHLFDLAQEYNKNMKQTFMAVLMPHFAILACLFFLHSGIGTAVILSQLGLTVGVGNALRPRFRRPPTILSDKSEP